MRSEPYRAISPMIRLPHNRHTDRQQAKGIVSRDGLGEGNPGEVEQVGEQMDQPEQHEGDDGADGADAEGQDRDPQQPDIGREIALVEQLA
jgi:hypothetical protein